jgi:mannose-1-phosphate guanylyltransferase
VSRFFCSFPIENIHQKKTGNIMQYAVIMAGGVGSRFWPSSRKSKPKQFLNLIGGKSMLQYTIERIKPLIPEERILIVTNSDYAELVQSQLPSLPAENIIGEPVAKNTAPCVAIAASILQQRDPDAVMVVLPADHYITQPDKFLDILRAGLEKASGGPNLVTIGITPHRPETGYGYIQTDVAHAGNGIEILQVKTFAEKPDLKTAISFMESGDFLWNSGMFMWSSKTILDQFFTHLPAIHREIEAFESQATRDFDKALNTFYQGVPSISIDYGIMERADTVFVIPGEFGWSDVGSWLAVFELGEKDAQGNVVTGATAIFEDSQNCMVKTSENKLVAVVGLQGIGVVDTGDTLLITRLDQSQDVKKIVDALDNRGLNGYK